MSVFHTLAIIHQHSYTAYLSGKGGCSTKLLFMCFCFHFASLPNYIVL